VNNFVWYVLLVACAFLGSGKESALEQHPFPLTEGTVWVYKGTVRWTAVGEPTVTTTKVEWRTEVRRVIRHAASRVAVITGFPSDLNWSNGNPKAQDSLLVESDGKFYLIAGELEEAIHRVEDPDDDLGGLLRHDNLLLQWPLEFNMKFCDPEGMARADNRYCWLVAESGSITLKGIAGASAGEHPEFVLQYRTNPDDTEFSFVPDIGITKYSYHHGTVADTDLKLVEFHPGGARKQ
jgi:hypothetical protein